MEIARHIQVNLRKVGGVIILSLTDVVVMLYPSVSVRPFLCLSGKVLNLLQVSGTFPKVFYISRCFMLYYNCLLSETFSIIFLKV